MRLRLGLAEWLTVVGIIVFLEVAWNVPQAKATVEEDIKNTAHAIRRARIPIRFYGGAQTKKCGEKPRDTEYHAVFVPPKVRRKGRQIRNWAYNFDNKLRLYKAYKKLLDNYESKVGKAEDRTAAERAEEDKLVDIATGNPPFKKVRTLLNTHDVPEAKTEASFKAAVTELWFGLVDKDGDGRGDSSGFESVFVGEVEDGKLTDVVSWNRYYSLQRSGALRYNGFTKAKTTGLAATLATVDFNLNGKKGLCEDEMIFGPRLDTEMALYTMCFYLKKDDDCLVSDSQGRKVYLWTESDESGKHLVTAHPHFRDGK